MSSAFSDLETKYRGKLLAAKSLPALPIVLQEALAVMDGSRTNLSKVAAIITRDQALTAKVLKMVNSPVYGFPGRISSIQNALVLLGVNVVRGLMVSTVVFDIISRSMMQLWEHSVACSIAAKELARILNYDNIEEYTLGGLLHDLGKVVIAIQIPEARRDMELLVRNEDIFHLEAEKLMLGFGHPHVNDWIAKHWNLPSTLRVPMACHHAPMTAGNYKTFSCVVHLADFLVHLFEKGFSGDDNVPELDPMALKFLKIDQKLLSEIVDRVGVALDKNTSFPVFA